eukprot:scaffold4163_cov425-Prasinococcus_capsulatus_cf.AAC.2
MKAAPRPALSPSRRWLWKFVPVIVHRGLHLHHSACSSSQPPLRGHDGPRSSSPRAPVPAPDVLWLEACHLQLPPELQRNVQPELFLAVRPRRHDTRLHTEQCRHLLTHFVGLAARAGADPCVHLRGIRSVALLHFVERVPHHVGLRAAPARVRRPHCL